MALRGSYITACSESHVLEYPGLPLIRNVDKKFHVEHFTCSLCSTLFGPQDSYYEHDGDVYCHYHYSTRFATKCAGCSSAILKQFVEINRNNRDECWHPECYMINKVSCSCRPYRLDLTTLSLYSSGTSSWSHDDRRQVRYWASTGRQSRCTRTRSGARRQFRCGTGRSAWSSKCTGYGREYPPRALVSADE